MSDEPEVLPPYLTTEAADTDLLEIGLSLRLHSPHAAAVFLRNVEKTLESLVRFPEMGRLREEFAPELRSFVVERYVLFYRITPDRKVLVIRVIHGMRDLSAILSSEGS